ncbi:MAG: DUF3782 domain-containing protein [Magnetococcales bacterium]|nr:DUF3782 domain-containing protein [Magnetococcales bacterium]
MSQAVTFDDVWKMFQETDRKFQEMVRENRERDIALDRKFQETHLQIKETHLQIKETNQQMKETNQQMKETDLQMKETDRKIKAVSRQIGQLGGRLGEFVEGLVAPACKTIFMQRGIPVHKVSRRMEADLPNDRHMEIDLFVVNTDTVSLVEVKSKLTTEDVREHMVRLSEFKEFFPEYADKRVVGAVAGMVAEEHVVRFAIKNGLFVLIQAGDSVRLANDDSFVPRAW